jgi:hypothetical protein
LSCKKITQTNIKILKMEQNEIKEQHKQTFKNKQTKMKTKNNKK